MNKKIMVSGLGFVFAAFAMSGIAFAQEANAPKAAPEAKAPAEVVRPAPKEVAPKEKTGEKKLKKALPPKGQVEDKGKMPPVAQPGDKGKVMPKPRGKMNGKGFGKPRGNMGCKCNCGCCAGGNRKFARPNEKMDGKKMMPMPKDGNKKFDGKNLPGRKFPGGEFKKGEVKEGEVPAPKPVAPKEAPKDAGEKKVK
ncbi:MAG: hypothetical protein IJJ66_02830 [Treponema sp.]|nr:hypothetical protein [Treponema sp.]